MGEAEAAGNVGQNAEKERACTRRAPEISGAHLSLLLKTEQHAHRRKLAEAGTP